MHEEYNTMLYEYLQISGTSIAQKQVQALKTINSKDIRILLNSDIKPIILKTDEDENLIQLLLPIKTY